LKKEKLASWLQQLTPSLRVHFSVLAIPLAARLPFFLNNMGFSVNGSLHENLSEFEELMIYYVFFMYFLELKQKSKAFNRNAERKESNSPVKLKYLPGKKKYDAPGVE
jgi:hypothetical protein